MIGPLLTAGAYLLGSISFGLLAARRAGVDLRATGSGNTGATNVGRALGRRTGRIVLLLDAGKGALVAWAGFTFLGFNSIWTAAAGLAAVVGHCFPIWYRFRGGKGAATALGVIITLVPYAGFAALAGYFGLKWATGRASVGSLVGLALGVAVTASLVGWTPRTWMTLAIAFVVLVRHSGNIARLFRNAEPPA